MIKVKVLKDYISTKGNLHPAGGEECWSGVGRFQRQLIDHGFVEVIKDEKAWQPQYDGEYYYIDDEGVVSSDTWNDHGIDYNRLKLGNVYKTPEDAKRFVEWLKAVKVLREDSDKSTVHGNKIARYSVWSNTLGLEIHAYAASLTGKTGRDNPFPFSTFEDASSSLHNHKSEWKLFLGIYE